MLGAGCLFQTGKLWVRVRKARRIACSFAQPGPDIDAAYTGSAFLYVYLGHANKKAESCTGLPASSPAQKVVL